MSGVTGVFIGFVLYVILLSRINPLILLLTTAATVTGFFVRRRANQWRYNHDDVETGYRKRTDYISSVGSYKKLAKDIRLFRMADWLNDVYNTYLKLRYDLYRKMEIKQYIADAVDGIAAFIREGAAYAYLIWMVLYREMPVDQFVLLFAAIGGFSGWITGVLDEITKLQRQSLEYCRVREFLEFPDSFRRADGEPVASQHNSTHSLELRNVSFRYPGAETNTLQGIDLTIVAGEKLAIVGLNGAGKTTLVKLLCGFYDPTEGEILVDGRDIRIFDRDQYYSLFTAVFQDFELLPFTLGQNVSGSAHYDAERARSSLEDAGFSERFASMPNDLDTLLYKEFEEEGVEVS